MQYVIIINADESPRPVLGIAFFQFVVLVYLFLYLNRDLMIVFIFYIFDIIYLFLCCPFVPTNAWPNSVSDGLCIMCLPLMLTIMIDGGLGIVYILFVYCTF